MSGEGRQREVIKLRKFLAMAIPLGVLFVLGHSIAWQVTGDEGFGGVALLIAVYLTVVGLSARGLHPGSVATVTQIVSYGLLVLVALGAAILPVGYTSATIASIVAVAVALPSVSGRRLALLTWIGSAVAIETVAVGVLAPVREYPRWIQLYASVGPALAFALLLIWLVYSFAAGELVMRVEAQTARDLALREQDVTRFLSDASRRLISELDYTTAIEGLASLAVPSLAECCIVAEVSERGPRWTGGKHCDPSKQALLEEVTRFAFEVPTHPVRRALETGALVYVEQLDEQVLDTYTRSPAHREALRQLAPTAIVAVPMRARSRSLGVLLMMTSEPGGSFSPERQVVIEEFARRAALALDNARLYRSLTEAVRARDEFLSIASHELRTPLTPLRLHLETLLREADSLLRGERSRQWLDGHLLASERQCGRLQRLIEELLDIGSIGAEPAELNLRTVDWEKIVREVERDLEDAGDVHAAGASVELELTSSVRGRWDPTRLRLIARHLLLNALKYGNRQPVTVRLEKESEGEWAVLTVIDRGIGIASEDHARVFEPFERAVSSRHFGGLGLGLFLVRRAAEVLGGSVELESQPGQGATLRVRLPVRGPGDEALAALGPSSPLPPP